MLRNAAFAPAALIGALIAGPAAAGETACWVDHGVVVVPAAFGPIAGDFILDLSAPRSELHATVAEGAGLTGTEARAVVQLAGDAAPADMAITDLDARGWGFPTGVAGVIGTDVLGRYAVELRLRPCRLTLWTSSEPRSEPTQALPLAIMAGVPAVAATVSDGRSALAGEFAIDTGSAGVRISDRLARLSPAPPGLDAGSRVAPPAKLAGLELAGEVFSRLPAGLEADAPSGLSGSLGDAVWSRYDWIRVDIPNRRLELGPRLR